MLTLYIAAAIAVVWLILHWNVAISSPLSRAVASVGAVLQGLGIVLVAFDVLRIDPLVLPVTYGLIAVCFGWLRHSLSGNLPQVVWSETRHKAGFRWVSGTWRSSLAFTGQMVSIVFGASLLCC